ncbi:MAG: GNAT family N-acetyltransferase [Actinomycetota bacterium]
MIRRPEPGVTVREASFDDLAAALDVYETVAAEGRWIGAEAPVDRERRLSKWRDTLEHPRETMFVAVAPGGEIVGNASMTWAGVSDLGMAVLDEWRRKGVGSALLRGCVDWARARQIHKIELRVWPHNTPAIALYEKFGFEKEGHLKRHYRRRNGELWDCLVYGLQL